MYYKLSFDMNCIEVLQLPAPQCLELQRSFLKPVPIFYHWRAHTTIICIGNTLRWGLMRLHKRVKPLNSAVK